MRNLVTRFAKNDEGAALAVWSPRGLDRRRLHRIGQAVGHPDRRCVYRDH
jgi:hypothetical protein